MIWKSVVRVLSQKGTFKFHRIRKGRNSVGLRASLQTLKSFSEIASNWFCRHSDDSDADGRRQSTSNDGSDVWPTLANGFIKLLIVCSRFRVDDDDVAATAEVRRWSWPAMSVDGGPWFESRKKGKVVTLAAHPPGPKKWMSLGKLFSVIPHLR